VALDLRASSCWEERRKKLEIIAKMGGSWGWDGD